MFLSVLALLLISPSLFGQTGENRIALGAHINLGKYLGTLSNGNFSLGTDFFLRWNILPQWSLHGKLGFYNLCYGIDDEDIGAFPEYFGSPSETHYPNTGGEVLREENSVTPVTTFTILGSYNLFPDNEFVPYLFAGLGIITLNPQNSDQGRNLPNNLLGDVYSKTQVTFPFGVGAEWYLNTNLALNGKFQINLTSTDYLDDLSDEGLPDGFASIGIGASYYIVGTLDCDGDGLSDQEEKRIGTDPCLLDTDGDNLTDISEVRVHGTDPLHVDPDEDGLNDAREIALSTNPRNPDTDGDNLMDGEEVLGDNSTDPLRADSDGDELSDGDEVLRHGTDPNDVDSDDDALSDGSEVLRHRTNPTALDTDGDELTDGDEVNAHGTDPLKRDTDADELEDNVEVLTHGTDPKLPDTDQDKLRDGEEVTTFKTSPTNPDTDGDGVIDGDDACPLIPGVKDRNGCPGKPKVGTITNFPAIYFNVNSDEFDFSRPQTVENLARVLAYVNQCPGLRVLIEGHASREGSEQRNRELSEMRSDRVKAWLIERGVPATKIQGTIGYGSLRNAVAEPEPNSAEAKSMDPDELEKIREQNRRIAVRVVRTCD